MKSGEKGWQVEVAVGVRALLSKAVWVQQAYCVLNDGTPNCYCLLGAIIHVMYPEQFLDETERPPWEIENAAVNFIVEACPEFAPQDPNEFEAQPIIDWNDRRTRTWEEVDAVVDRLVTHYSGKDAA